MTIASTLARTGRLMKNAEIIGGNPGRLLGRGGRRRGGGWRGGWWCGGRRRGCGRRGDGGFLGHDLSARDRLAIGREHDAIVGSEAGRDHAQTTDQQLTGGNPTLLDDIVLVDDQHVLAG